MTCSRARCRSRRFTRLRTTALPTALLTTNPTRGRVAPASVGRPRGARRGCDYRPGGRPRTACRKDRRRRSAGGPRAARRATWVGRASRQTARLLRPLRRREDRIARPARVRMRRRNPCTLWRRRLFGWYVRLLTSDSLRWWVMAVTPGTGRGADSARTSLSAGTAHPRHRPSVDDCGIRGHAAPVDTG